ncbi:uncharacterized protein LOC104905082 [Beta vulgaris subsp. vulgaris]|uniref:uncharacterized protein LOC104905082 n=1 Tax=Beta vulgaris subsp. vulgaris TaxID=3555 RepID=UPI0009014DB9|nr:uncharacterized protein LOC104905082 [Beta vulgaris subsp. vulgaris]
MSWIGGGERHLMKLKDKELEEEREREIKMEGKSTQDRPTTKIIKHFTHTHPLICIDTDYARFVCDVCNCKGRGKRYHCAQCDFDLHKTCAESPIVWLLHKMPPEDIEKFGILHDIDDSFAHPNHLLKAEYRHHPFSCNHCNNVGDGLRYHCDACNVTFHEVCAQHPTRLASHLHPQHELELKLRPSAQGIHCELCGNKGKASNNRVYTCYECNFFVHPQCSQLPLYLLHPLHPPHPLLLKRSRSDYRCSACSRWKTDECKYSCTRCALEFDLTCIMEKSILGLGDVVRHNYTENMIKMLPVANLTSSYAPKRDPPSPIDYYNAHNHPLDVMEVLFRPRE